MFEREYGRWLRDVAQWQGRRVAATARLLGIPPGEVMSFDTVCRALYDVPEGPKTGPVMRRDRRYGPHRPS